MKRIAVLFAVVLMFMPLVSGHSPVAVGGGTERTALTSEADLNRVEWRTDLFSNPGFEAWYDEYRPAELATYRTGEHYANYASAPWPVNEGPQSFVVQARTPVPSYASEALLVRGSWGSWNNPTNLTMSFDWYIDELPNPVDVNYLRLVVEFSSPGIKSIHYYFNSQDTLRANGTWNAYIWISGDLQSWNHFDRNLTEDYFEIWGEYPNYQFRTFTFELHAETSNYCRAFFDDFWIVNNTVIIGGDLLNGNFNSPFGPWRVDQNTDLGEIKRCTARQEGDYSANLTVSSNGNTSYARVYDYDSRKSSPSNPDALSFQWMIDDAKLAGEDTYAYFEVNWKNSTEDSYVIRYPLFYIGTTFPVGSPDDLLILPMNFNVTGQWNVFEHSVWDDLAPVNDEDFIIIDSMEFHVYSSNPGARLSLLIDDISHIGAALWDMGYEDESDLGQPIWAWDLSSDPEPTYTSTSVAHTGTRAANMTIENGNYLEGSRYFGYLPVNNKTDIYLDLFWRVEDASELEEDILYFEVNFASDESLGYILMNYSDASQANGFDELILVPGNNVVGEWINLQRNLYFDFVDTFGYEPDTTLYSIKMYAWVDLAGRMEILFDDLYLYTDPEPGIYSVSRTDANPDIDTPQEITAEILEPSIDEVILWYNVNSTGWVEVAMTSDLEDVFSATIPGQPNNTEVQYYVSASDLFLQSSESDVYTYIVVGYITPTTTTLPPPFDPAVLIVAVVSIAVVGVVIVYLLVVKPKQQAAGLG